MYEVTGWAKFCEEDIFEEGCQPETATSSVGSDRFTDETIEGLLEKLMQFAGVDEKEAMLRNACDEVGRVDIQRMENCFCTEPTDYEDEAWREGKIKLYLATYMFYVEVVTRTAISVAENNGG